MKNATEHSVYIDSGNPGQVITCHSTSCISVKGSSLPGHAYIDSNNPEKKSIITCSNGNCSNPTIGLTEANIYFIDGSDPTKIITCNSNNGCSSNTPTPTERLNFVDGLASERSITCNTNGCISTIGKNKNTLHFNI